LIFSKSVYDSQVTKGNTGLISDWWLFYSFLSRQKPSRCRKYSTFRFYNKHA